MTLMPERVLGEEHQLMTPLLMQYWAVQLYVGNQDVNTNRLT
jgi:hypothetical protein